MRIRALQSQDDMSSFSCGVSSVDEWFCTHAHANQGRFSSTYVMVDEGGRLIGGLAIAATTVKQPKGETEGPPSWPVLLIGQLSVDLAFHKRGLGHELMEFAFRRAIEMSQLCGAEYVVLDALLNVVSFYEKYGFRPLSAPKSGHVRMFLELRAVKEMVAMGDAAALSDDAQLAQAADPNSETRRGALGG